MPPVQSLSPEWTPSPAADPMGFEPKNKAFVQYALPPSNVRFVSPVCIARIIAVCSHSRVPLLSKCVTVHTPTGPSVAPEWVLTLWHPRGARGRYPAARGHGPGHRRRTQRDRRCSCPPTFWVSPHGHLRGTRAAGWGCLVLAVP